ncbi:Urea ABC transporter, substrate binding protein UrtA [Fimbriiglobus ruber]|uniref:Urea ABC transporter, substrate binding protein UrtA n=2 Tax=Fimbriiglobus ruber TaxID=1908690 RepID=A0A225DGB0_9BACT|nr:Urea ABC transporter, substrate binding protein UrtA [Fimbriiglobus ruber]
MGVVYEAEDIALKRRVAVKVILPELVNEQFRTRFLREAQLAASLKSDHVVTIYQVGEHNGLPYLVMEYLEGESLEDRLQRSVSLRPDEAFRIALGAAEGLRDAHARGLIHRDVKPANIWLDADGPGQPFRRVKLLDFGLAKTLTPGPALTGDEAAIGTAGYMAPEQIYGGPLDGRTDLYALGCVLFRSLWGRFPYHEPDTMKLLDAVVYTDVPDLDEATARLPGPAAALVRRLLSRNPDERPASAAEVVERLREIVPGGGDGPPKARADRWPLIGAAVLVVLLAAAIAFSAIHRANPDDENPDGRPFTGDPIKVGVLHSLSGTFSESGRSMVEAVTLAADEINDAGGILGRKVVPLIVDGHSDELRAGELAEELITIDQVAVVFGCWNSPSRKRVADVCEKKGNLLVFSSTYEGLEQKPAVVYVCGAPNQQLEPATRWAYAYLHKRKFFLVGSNYVYSHAAHQILSDDLKKLGATVVGEAYVPPEGTDFGAIVKQIQDTGADVVMNTVDGTSNIAYFQAMWTAGVKPDRVPTFWIAADESEMRVLRLQELVGDYVVAPYFESIDTLVNRAFVKRHREKYPARRVGDAAEATYAAVYLWKQAVEAAGVPDPPRVREAFKGQEYEAPEGKIRIDPETMHAWRTARIACVKTGPAFEIVYTSPGPVSPEPFPSSRPRAAWETYLDTLYKGWGNRWEGSRR